MRKLTIALLMLILLLGICACSVTENAPAEIIVYYDKVG